VRRVTRQEDVACQENELVCVLIATANKPRPNLMSTRHTHLPVSLVVAPDPRDSSDAELARALLAGNSWAIAQTWSRFGPSVIMFAKRALGSESEAEDIAQEVFCRVFAKSKTLREPERLRSFIFSFAIRVLRTELRRKRTRAWLSFHRSETLVDLGGELTDMESRDLLRRFYSLLDLLAPRHRLVFALRHLESMTVEEVAAHMDISVSTVKRLQDRATSKLSSWIEADPGLAEFVDEWGYLR
jgi:RNA polymerase sigma-70 factor (ECF subfamily)